MCGFLLRTWLLLIVINWERWAVGALMPLDGVWQPVSGMRNRFFVYSAYLEYRVTEAVRIIAATKSVKNHHVRCKLSLNNNKTTFLKAEVKPIFGNFDSEFSISFVLCYLNSSKVTLRDAAGSVVSIVSRRKPIKKTSNFLLVQDTRPKKNIDNTLHICVKPIHSGYNQDQWIIEWLEMQQLLGVSHFYIYNESMSSTVGCLLDSYKQRGLVTLLPWRTPFVPKKISFSSRTGTRFAAYNDCLYRSMAHAGWLLLLDIDEIVFPRRETSLMELINKLKDSKAPELRASAFLFRNAFFYKSFKNDDKMKSNLITAQKTRRIKANALYDQSKYVVNPRSAIELGSHFVQRMHGSAFSMGVSENLALVHHYKDTCDFGKDCNEGSSFLDQIAHEWTDKLTRRVLRAKTQDKQCLPPDTIDLETLMKGQISTAQSLKVNDVITVELTPPVDKFITTVARNFTTTERYTKQPTMEPTMEPPSDQKFDLTSELTTEHTIETTREPTTESTMEPTETTVLEMTEIDYHRKKKYRWNKEDFENAITAYLYEKRNRV